MCMSRIRERHGTVRVSTAYEFYSAVQEHLVLNKRSYERREKPPFEATAYHLHYFAANAEDEVGKEGVSGTLDRTKMWNCSVLKGSSSCHEFVGLPRGNGGEYRIKKRFLPCPCSQCRDELYHLCENVDIVEQMEEGTMKLINAVECPDVLTVPLSEYTIATLKSFIKLNNNNKLPSECTTKPTLIRYITTNLAHYVARNGNANAAGDEV